MKFYKVLREDMTHHGFTYKTGLNVDTIPFDPSGDCLPGGFYFSREDILAFLDYGEYIAEVVIPEDAQVYENPGAIQKKWKADKIILREREKITPEVIERLVEEGANIHAGWEVPLRWALGVGNIEFVKVFIKLGADIHADNNYALRWACKNGQAEVVELLIEKGADIHAENNVAFSWALYYKHTKVINLLVAADEKSKI